VSSGGQKLLDIGNTHKKLRAILILRRHHLGRLLFVVREPLATATARSCCSGKILIRSARCESLRSFCFEIAAMCLSVGRNDRKAHAIHSTRQVSDIIDDRSR